MTRHEEDCLRGLIALALIVVLFTAGVILSHMPRSHPPSIPSSTQTYVP